MQVNLSSEDLLKLSDVAGSQKRTKGEVAREAIRWYVINYEKLKEDSRDSLMSLEIKKMANRLAAMLARIHVEVGTLYELQFRYTDPDLFEEALHTTKQRVRNRLQKDERDVSAKMAGQIAGSPVEEPFNSNKGADVKAPCNCRCCVAGAK